METLEGLKGSFKQDVFTGVVIRESHGIGRILPRAGRPGVDSHVFLLSNSNVTIDWPCGSE